MIGTATLCISSDELVEADQGLDVQRVPLSFFGIQMLQNQSAVVSCLSGSRCPACLLHTLLQPAPAESPDSWIDVTTRLSQLRSHLTRSESFSTFVLYQQTRLTKSSKVPLGSIRVPFDKIAWCASISPQMVLEIPRRRGPYKLASKSKTTKARRSDVTWTLHKKNTPEALAHVYEEFCLALTWYL